MSLPGALERALQTTFYLYTAHLSPYLPPTLDIFLRRTSVFLSTLLLPTLTSGDLTSIAALLVILYISLRTLDYLRRSIFGWVFFFVKLGLLVVVVQGLWYVNAYGWDKAVDDVSWLAMLGWGFLEGVWDGGGGAGGNANSGGRGFGGGKGNGRAKAGRNSGWGGNDSGRQQWGATGAGRNRWT